MTDKQKDGKTEAQGVVWNVLQIGNYGAAYDLAGARRAFTYEHQPGNVLASRLGSAANNAVAASAGDSIDRGLSLLKALQAEGFGVFQVDPSALSTPASHDAQQPVSAGMERLVRAVTAAQRERDEKEVLSSSTMGEMWLALEALAQQPAVVGDGWAHARVIRDILADEYAPTDDDGSPSFPAERAALVAAIAALARFGEPT